MLLQVVGREVSQTRENVDLFALDFARIRGIDCTRCWPIKYVFDRAFASGSCESTRVVRYAASFFVLATDWPQRARRLPFFSVQKELAYLM